MHALRSLPLFAALWVALLPASGAARQQSQIQQRPPVFRTGLDAVRLDVLAVDRGKPIASLTPDDFEVKDNGVAQKVDLATIADHVSLVISLDVQRSRRQTNEELVRASQTLASCLLPADRAWLLTFAQSFDLRAGPTNNPAVIQTALANAPFAGGKTLWDALFASVSLVAGLDGRALVIVFSDGGEPFFKAGWLDEDRAIDALRRSEVTVAAVQPRSDVSSPTALERAARATGGVVIEAERTPHLKEQFDGLLNDFRLSYLLTYTPAGVGRGDGWHKLSVRLRNRPGSVTTREGYFSGPPR